MQGRCWHLAFALLSSACANDSANDKCIESLEELCNKRTCPSSPRSAESDPDTYPQVHHNGDKFVIGLNSGLGASEFHFVGEELVGYLEFDDQIQENEECPGILTLGTLNIDSEEDNRGLTELSRDCSDPSSADEVEACSHLCTFNDDWEERLERCPTGIFDAL